MKNQALAIATVTPQPWGTLHTQKDALCQGTIFKDLTLPFYAAEDIPCTTCGGAQPKSSQEAQREELMAQLTEVSFFLDDLTLFLDTHPQEKQGLQLFSELSKKRQQLLQQFKQDFYPLTRDTMCTCDQQEEFCWTKGPLPWEGACI